jgi:GTPase-associated protein 1, N-terminal domain type 2/GTPase-associated protein 1, middle domain
MGFAQLHYTSCESGLSDFAGFQFSAATPGVPPPLMREVEALTAYEPPPSLGPRPDPARIASCPVNLVYSGEPAVVIANVVFTGADFSRRMGNYFAHALVGLGPDDRLGSILPIELWGSPFWVAASTAGAELPALDGPPPVARPPLIDRDGVDAFLRERPAAVAVLLTAAEEAVLRRGRPVVVVEADTRAAAHWIAAISFLLAPAVARRMSFATYRHRPEYSSGHVVATLPESDFELDDAAFVSYVVLDGASGRLSPVPPEPAAELLARAGAGRAARLWTLAAHLDPALDPAPTLAAARPALVAAALREGVEVTAADLDALAAWTTEEPERLRALLELLAGSRS